MRVHRIRKNARQGFTLIEILIVIAIVGVLTGMVSSAMAKVLGMGHRAHLASEIRQLATAVETFKERYGFYPPSRFILCERFQDYFLRGDPSQGALSKLHEDSFTYLNRMFPRCGWQTKLGPSGMAPSLNGIDWNGNAQIDPPVVLEGDQCLVFFLGGIPSNSDKLDCTGFSTNPRDPAAHAHGMGSETIPPLYEFSSSRLTIRPPMPNKFYWNAGSQMGRTPVLLSTTYYSYLDPYGAAPYVYLSSCKTANGYNRYGALIHELQQGNKFRFTSDCASLRVWPYASSGLPPGQVQYMNPNTFQIISAGADGIFGRGSDLFNNYAPQRVPTAHWNMTVAGNIDLTSVSWGLTDPVQEAGLDDMSNFYKGELGIPGAD